MFACMTSWRFPARHRRADQRWPVGMHMLSAPSRNYGHARSIRCGLADQRRGIRGPVRRPHRVREPPRRHAVGRRGHDERHPEGLRGLGPRRRHAPPLHAREDGPLVHPRRPPRARELQQGARRDPRRCGKSSFVSLYPRWGVDGS